MRETTFIICVGRWERRRKMDDIRTLTLLALEQGFELRIQKIYRFVRVSWWQDGEEIGFSESPTLKESVQSAMWFLGGEASEFFSKEGRALSH